MIRWTVPVAALAALILVVTGCGGSKKSSDSTAATTPTTATVSSSSGSSSSSDSSSTDTSTSSDTSTSTDSGSVSDAAAKSCLNFASAAAKLGSALSSAGSQASSEETKRFFESLADKAPSDIKASFQIFADAFGKYLDAVKGLKFEPGKVPSATDLAKQQNALKALSTTEVRAASEKINNWVKAGCHS